MVTNDIVSYIKSRIFSEVDTDYNFEERSVSVTGINQTISQRLFREVIDYFNGTEANVPFKGNVGTVSIERGADKFLVYFDQELITVYRVFQ